MARPVRFLWRGLIVGWLGGMVFVAALAIPATADEPPAAAAKQPRVEGYRVELPDGATIELVGIGQHPQEIDARWWKPDGKALEPPVDRESFITADVRQELTRLGGDSLLLREVAVRVRIDPLGSVRLSGTADSVVQGGTRYGVNGLIRGSYSFTAEKKPLKISVAYSGGKWTRRASADIGGKSDVKDVKFEPLVSENGSVNGSLTHPWLTDETRIVAFRRQGKRHMGVANSHSQRGKLATHSFRFDDVALTDIAAIHLESRPTTIVEFRGVALKPGEKAAVEILVDGKPLSEPPAPKPAKEKPAPAN
jgi:hypothetical protein